MVCANITFKTPLGKAVNLSSLPNAAGWPRRAALAVRQLELMVVVCGGGSSAGEQMAALFGGSLHIMKVIEN